MKKLIKNLSKKLKENRGSEILQVILISGVLLVLIITLFYPQMEELFKNVMETITNWFENTGSDVFRV